MPRTGPPTTRKPRVNPEKIELRPTDIPGVYKNMHQQCCDESGRLLTLAQVKVLDDARWIEIYGKVPETPAEMMKAYALDPRNHIADRLTSAKNAAPYYDMKMPLRVDGTMDHKGSLTAIDAAKLSAMSKDDRNLLLKLLKQLGVTL